VGFIGIHTCEEGYRYTRGKNIYGAFLALGIGIVLACMDGFAF
jgi:hypothetical protein